MKELIKKLANAKKEIGAISKDSTNPFYKSKYFDINTLLAQVEPILQTHDLIVLQPIKDNKVYTIIYDVETAEQIESSLDLPTINDPQKLGGAITYFRRYTLQSLLSLQSEDDDGNAASKASKNITPSQKVFILNLIETSVLNEDDRVNIEGSLNTFDFEKAQKCIAYLKENQLPAMENQNPNQTDIKNHLKTK